MSELELQKTTLRREMRARRARLSKPEQQHASEQLYSSIEQLPGWNECRSIALYLATDGEIDPGCILAKARQLKKQILLPVVEGNSLAFAMWNEEEALQNNRYDIPEPAANAPRLAPESIDIICLPLVAWDKKGGRLGMGGGFYDRALAKKQANIPLNTQGPIIVGLGHSFQETEDIPMQRWDIRLQYFASEQGLLKCGVSS